jgi:hypothetical protein
LSFCWIQLAFKDGRPRKWLWHWKRNDRVLLSLWVWKLLRGYQAIWHALRIKHHIHVPRRLVERILRELNPEVVLQRRERRLRRRIYLNYGPNFCWHIDGKPDLILGLKLQIEAKMAACKCSFKISISL